MNMIKVVRRPKTPYPEVGSQNFIYLQALYYGSPTHTMALQSLSTALSCTLQSVESFVRDHSENFNPNAFFKQKNGRFFMYLKRNPEFPTPSEILAVPVQFDDHDRIPF